MKLALPALTLLAASQLNASVALTVWGGQLRNELGDPVADGSLAILVADVDGDGFTFGSGLLGATFEVNDLFGGDNLVLGVYSTYTDGGLGAGVFNGNADFDYAGNFEQGDQLGLYWFPYITQPETGYTSLQAYGFFRTNDTYDPLNDSLIGFTAPADGAWTLDIFDNNANPQSLISPANLTAQAIPEPSTYALMAGTAMLGLAALRRKRK